MRRLLGAVLVTATLSGAACGDGEDRPGQVTSETNDRSGTGSVSGSVSGVGPAEPSKGAAGFTPVSAVAEHAAIGKDIAETRKLMDPATKDQPVDWKAVAKVFREGGGSKKSDGSNRTLATLVNDAAATRAVADAIDGTGASAGKSDKVRRQQADKGLSVLLERKVLDELKAAADKMAKNDIAPATGAPHNVDEAWAFYEADGQGLGSLASKRAADFKRDGRVSEPVVAGLAKAQQAAVKGDAAAFQAATAEVEQALDHVFYLATFKYLDTKGDPVAAAEGQSFYQAIQPEVAAASPSADAAITRAFTSADPAAGRAALNSAEVRRALGIDDGEQVTSVG